MAHPRFTFVSNYNATYASTDVRLMIQPRNRTQDVNNHLYHVKYESVDSNKDDL